MRRPSILLMTAAALFVATNATLADEPPAPHPPEPVAQHGNGAQLELLRQKLAELERLQSEVDVLREVTHTPAVVVVNVELLEVSLTGMRKLGIDIANFTEEGVTSPNFTTGGYVGLLGKFVSTNGAGAAEFVNVLKRNNLAKTLAEPTLMTVSGKPASLHVGGQFPVPVPPESAEFRKWGTELDLLTEILGNGKVRLQIRSHVSEPIDDRSIIVDGQSVPSLRSKSCNAACELAFGETFVLGGLVERRVERLVRDESVVSDEVHEVATLMVVHVEEVGQPSVAASTPQRLVQPAEYTPPTSAARRTAPHDSIRR
jgi:Flp pilus assembly secretin CpaC